MKTLVAYMSQTGNTKKIAEAIFGEIRDEKEIRKVDEVESLDGYGIAFLGFPMHVEGPDKKAVKFLEKHCLPGRKVALFITHASPEDGPDLPPMIEKFIRAAQGADLIDLFHCQGELAKSVKRIMSIWPNAKFRKWAREDNSQGQPDEIRIERARAFSADVMKRLQGAPGPSMDGRIVSG